MGNQHLEVVDLILENHGLGAYIRRMNDTTKGLIYSNYYTCKDSNPIFTKEIPIEEIYATQEQRYQGKIDKANDAKNRYFPILVGTFTENGKIMYYIFDGHHRTGWCYEDGRKTVRAFVLNTDKKPVGNIYLFLDKRKGFLRKDVIPEGGSDSPYAQHQTLGQFNKKTNYHPRLPLDYEETPTDWDKLGEEGDGLNIFDPNNEFWDK